MRGSVDGIQRNTDFGHTLCFPPHPDLRPFRTVQRLRNKRDVAHYVSIFFFLRKTNRTFSTTVTQLKICDFSGEAFKGFEVL